MARKVNESDSGMLQVHRRHTSKRLDSESSLADGPAELAGGSAELALGGAGAAELAGGGADVEIDAGAAAAPPGPSRDAGTAPLSALSLCSHGDTSYGIVTQVER